MKNENKNKSIVLLLLFCIGILYGNKQVALDEISTQLEIVKEENISLCIINNNLNKQIDNLIEIKKELKTTKESIAKQCSINLIEFGTFEATAYDLGIASCGKSRSHKGFGITASGFPLVNKSWDEARTIAVDPKIIPLGSKIFVEFLEDEYKDRNGIYIANDTGSAIKGNRIDIFVGDTKDSTIANRFGRRDVKLYLIK